MGDVVFTGADKTVTVFYLLFLNGEQTQLTIHRPSGLCHPATVSAAS